MPTIRTYASADCTALVQLMTELQGYLASVDPLNRVRQIKDFDAEKSISNLLQKIEGNKGTILIADDNGNIQGFIAGMPEETRDIVEHYPGREGTILELVVAEQYRGQGIGNMLMSQMESYFKENDCQYARVGCLASNTRTHEFYEKCGYEDRYIEMLKKL